MWAPAICKKSIKTRDFTTLVPLLEELPKIPYFSTPAIIVGNIEKYWPFVKTIYAKHIEFDKYCDYNYSPTPIYSIHNHNKISYLMQINTDDNINSDEIYSAKELLISHYVCDYLLTNFNVQSYNHTINTNTLIPNHGLQIILRVYEFSIYENNT